MPKLIKQIVLHKSFKFYLFLNFINIFYYLLFELGDVESLKYLFSRLAGLSMFAISIEINADFYKEKMFPWISNLLILLCVAGVFFNFPSVGRYSGLIGNYNEFGVLMSIAFGFKYIAREKHDFSHWSILILLALMTVFSGSRAAIIGLIIPVFFVEKSILKPLLIMTLIGGGVFLLTELNQSENSFSRLSSNEPLLSNRIKEYQYAILTFKNKWLLGNGLSNYSYINADLIATEDAHHMIGSHNGYLAVLVQYGVLFSSFFFLNLFYGLRKIKIFVLVHWEKRYVKSFVFIIVYGLIYSLFETVMTGINNFHTALFWLAFGLLFHDAYQYKQSKKT